MEPKTKTGWPSMSETALIWGKVGLLSFGGPTAQIAMMHRLIVAERRWLNESQFLNAVSFCMLLPGPEAMQLATYVGWRIQGIVGGLVAGLLFVLPGAIFMLGLGFIYISYGTIGLMEGTFLGLKAAIVVIVLQALLRLAQKSLKTRKQWTIAAFGFFGIFVFALPFPFIIGLAALYGFTCTPSSSNIAINQTPLTLPKVHDTIKTLLFWLCLWWAPLLAIDFIAGEPLLADIGYFFSKLAVVTFGGAYAGLAYMAQDVVSQLNWLSPNEMMDGLGLAETTPGPLILVTEFVGFLAGFKAAGLAYGIAGAMLALWATFIPSFLWIFAGAAYLDWLTHQPRLSGALESIMATVVGVIANLFIWFALHLFFSKTSTFNFGAAQILLPNLTTLDIRVTAIAIVCGWLGFITNVGLFWLLGIAALAGILSSMPLIQ